MKKILLTLVGIICSLGMWAADVTLFTTSFTSAEGWTTENLTTSEVTTATKTINGTTLTFYGYKSTGFSVATEETGKTYGTLTCCGSNPTVDNSKSTFTNAVKYCVGIPLTNVNGSITITTTGDAVKWYYGYDDGNTGMPTQNRIQFGQNNTQTITGLTNSNVTLYIGCSGKKMNSITITTPDASDPKITFASDHGTVPAETNASIYTLPTLVENGYTNTGWKANVDVTVDDATVTAGTAINCGTSVTLSAATTFTAQWEEYNPTAVVTYDFSRWSVQDFAAGNVTYDDVTVTNDASHTLSIASRSKTIDGKAFTRALYIPGASVSSGRIFSIPVTGACTIDVYLASGKSSESRDVTMYTGTWGVGTATATFSASADAKVSYDYTGDAATLTFGASGGMYVYGVNVTVDDGSSTLSWTANLNTAESSIGTASKTSATSTITAVSDITNNGSLTIESAAKTNLTSKIEAPTAKDDSKYMSVSFTMADGHGFCPSTITVPVQPVSAACDVYLVLTDGTNSIDNTGSVEKGKTVNQTITNTENIVFSGTVTLKIYVYGASTGTYRLGAPITIEGYEGTKATLNASGFATFSNTSDVMILGAEVKKCSVSGTTLTFTTVDGGQVPAGNGVLLKGDESANYIVCPVASATAISDNALVSTNGATVGSYDWTLSGNTFMHFAGTSFNANKAYLHFDSDPFGGSAKAFTIVFDDMDAPTAVSAVEAADAQATKKVVVNGQFRIVTANGTFNAAGARIK